jgi:hypothetical protein
MAMPACSAISPGSHARTITISISMAGALSRMRGDWIKTAWLTSYWATGWQSERGEREIAA